MIYYFAYGSNVSEHRMINERKINYHSRKFAILKDYKLVFNKQSKKNKDISYANIEKSNGDFVEGALYSLNDSDIRILDVYEGYPSHYKKEIVDIFCENKYVKSIVYIANENMINNNSKPSSVYLSYILEGKDIFSENYFKKLNETNVYKKN